MRLLLHISFITLILLLSCKSSEQKTVQAPKEKILEVLSDHDYNGAFLYAEQGEIIIKKVMGFRDFERSDNLEVDHVFYLASLSKQITAMACMMLAHEHKLTLEDKLSFYFPELPFANKVTLIQMLNHTSGIPDYYGMGIYKPGMKNEDVYQALLTQDQLDFEPGSAYSYSNSAYVLLSMVVAKADGQSFKEFVEERIFAPLEMKHSVVFDETAQEIPIRAVGHDSAGKKKDYHAYTTGGGGIFSNISDLFLWERALYGNKLLPQTKLQDAYKPAKLTNGEVSYYGMGWVLDEKDPFHVSHTGSLEGFRNLISRNLKQERVFIFLTNNSNENLKQLVQEIEAILEVS